MRLLNPLVALFLLPYALAALVWKTHDISSLLVEEKKGVVYKDASGQVQPLEQILKKGGANSIKIRIWVDPPSGEYNLDYGIRLGKRAKAAGLAVVINFHYSDTWVSSDRLVFLFWMLLSCFLSTDYYRRIRATRSNRRNGRDWAQMRWSPRLGVILRKSSMLSMLYVIPTLPHWRDFAELG
jgi:hypothetical protein